MKNITKNGAKKKTIVFFLCQILLCLSLSSGQVNAQDRYLPKDFQERMLQDWMLQDGLRVTDPSKVVPDVETIEKVLDEIAGYDDNNAVDGFRNELQYLRERRISVSDSAWLELYKNVCAERRRLRLEIVRQKYPILVYARHHVLGGSHYAYTESPTDAQFPERRDIPGGQLLTLEIRSDGTVAEKLLFETEKGLLRDPDVSFDGKKIVFSLRKHLTEDDFHLYNYDTETGAVRQLTFGPGFADVEPCYLPDGNIVFCSTRCMQIVDCWWTDVTNLYLCDADGRFLRRIGFDQVHTNYPKVLEDGRVIYTRWDYNDRGQLYPQPLFVMNYDGTGQTEYYGNNSWFPTTIMHARGIPNSSKVVAVASGHHTHQRGKLLLIDRSRGTQENEGCRLIAPPRETEAVVVDRYGQGGEQFQYPLAVDEENFIVAYTPEGFVDGKNHYDIPFGIYYMDVDNRKRELLAWDRTISSGQPVPLQARTAPTLRATPVDYRAETGFYYVQDVYFGPGLEGVERGTVKELRIVALEFRAAGILNNNNRGPAGSALVSTPISIDNGSWDVKRVLGTVPIEEDGSAYFEVPARTPVYFQLLDERGEVVQTMRSWSTLQPGEMFSCVGCHEPKGATRNNPLSRGGAMRTRALRKAPKTPKPLNGSDNLHENIGFSFERIIQPIFDTHCVDCHVGGKWEDGTDAPFSLLGKRYEPEMITVKHKDGREEQRPDVVMAGRRFSESYVNLTQKGKPNEIVNWLNAQSIPTMLPPYFAGAAKSRLTRMFDDGNRSESHEKVILTDLEKRQIATWIDLLVPFSGSYTESVDWNDRQKAEYAYYQAKRDRMAEIERQNILKLISWQNGDEIPSPNDFVRFDAGGPEFKKKFIEEFLEKLRRDAQKNDDVR